MSIIPAGQSIIPWSLVLNMNGLLAAQSREENDKDESKNETELFLTNTTLNITQSASNQDTTLTLN